MRALLLERAASALAHEGKNPLHNMMLHLQLLDEKLREKGPGVALVRDGALRISIETDGPRTRLELLAEGGAPRREEAAPHLEAVRRLSSEAAAELSLDAGPAAPARLSLSFAHPR